MKDHRFYIIQLKDKVIVQNRKNLEIKKFDSYLAGIEFCIDHKQPGDTLTLVQIPKERLHHCQFCNGIMLKSDEVKVPLIPEPKELQFKYDVLECVNCNYHCHDLINATRINPLTEELEVAA